MIPLGRILISRPVTLFCLLSTTLWDILSTYATVGDRLWLDGNPFIRNLTWRQVIPLQVILLALSITAFLLVYRRQEAIWPDQRLGFLRFVKYRLKKGFSLNFTTRHFKTEDVYAGMLLIWFLIFARAMAGFINSLQLLLGTSLLHLPGLTGAHEIGLVQKTATACIIMLSLLMAHYPLYLSYRLTRWPKNSPPEARDAGSSTGPE